MRKWFYAFYPIVYVAWRQQRRIHGDLAPDFPEWVQVTGSHLVAQYREWLSAHQDPGS